MGTCHDSQKPEGASGGERPLSLGLIADIQYADREDGSDFEGLEQRHFRHALEVLKAAVECFNETGVSKVVQLGDVIDGCNAKADATWSALKAVLSVLNQSNAERIDLVGNHELYNIRRANLPMSGLRCATPEGIFYRTVSLNEQWEAVVLDPYELALIGIPDSEIGFQKAEKILRAQNPQVLGMEGGGDWYKGLSVDKHRYVPFNGGLSVEQLAWLEQVLRASKAERRKVLVFSHVPLYEPATKAKTLVWNCEETLSVLHRFDDTVVGVFAGHDHDGGYAVDKHGLHHITMHSALTAPEGSHCFAILECRQDGSALFRSHGRACVESGTRGMGKAYTEILLAKGAKNLPLGAALEGGGGAPD